jgi:hypothetical protein
MLLHDAVAQGCQDRCSENIHFCYIAQSEEMGGFDEKLSFQKLSFMHRLITCQL